MAAGSVTRNLRASYLPIVLYKKDGRTQGEQIHDHLNAGYESIRDDITDYEQFIVTDAEEGMPDSIAYKFYRDESLWWVVCLYNGIIDPFNDLVTGKKLRIPNASSVELYLTRKSQPAAAAQRKNTFTTV